MLTIEGEQKRALIKKFHEIKANKERRLRVKQKIQQLEFLRCLTCTPLHDLLALVLTLVTLSLLPQHLDGYSSTNSSVHAVSQSFSLSGAIAFGWIGSMIMTIQAAVIFMISFWANRRYRRIEWLDTSWWTNMINLWRKLIGNKDDGYNFASYSFRQLILFISISISTTVLWIRSYTGTDFSLSSVFIFLPLWIITVLNVNAFASAVGLEQTYYWHSFISFIYWTIVFFALLPLVLFHLRLRSIYRTRWIITIIPLLTINASIVLRTTISFFNFRSFVYRLLCAASALLVLQVNLLMILLSLKLDGVIQITYATIFGIFSWAIAMFIIIYIIACTKIPSRVPDKGKYKHM